jgi:uncharacterized protein (TIGR02186 family)
LAAMSIASLAQDTSETIEADVSVRSVSIDTDFTGLEIVLFGTVENSQQPSAEAGTYDVVVVVEGATAPHKISKRSNVVGLWVNTETMRFASLPSYYALATTRPIADIAEQPFLSEQQIGFENIRMVPAGSGRVTTTDPDKEAEFRNSIVRLKNREGLYLQADYGVTFVGKSLFRTTIRVPPRVPVSSLKAKIYLLREGALLDTYEREVMLTRSGLERVLYDGAKDYPFLYGLGAILLAISAGLASAFVFNRT